MRINMSLSGLFNHKKIKYTHKNNNNKKVEVVVIKRFTKCQFLF